MGTQSTHANFKKIRRHDGIFQKNVHERAEHPPKRIMEIEEKGDTGLIQLPTFILPEELARLYIMPSGRS